MAPLPPLAEGGQLHAAELHAAGCPFVGNARCEALLRVAQRIFRVPATAILLLGDRKNRRSAFLGLEAGQCGSAQSLCEWVLVPEQPEVLIVTNCQQDARFMEHPVVQQQGWRFFAGAPLLAANNHRIGSLCVLDTQVRHLDVDSAALLCSLAEAASSLLASRSRSGSRTLSPLALTAQEQPAEASPSPAPAATAAERTGSDDSASDGPEIDAPGGFAEAFAVVDSQQPGWPLLYCSDAFLQDADLKCAPSLLWGAFHVSNDVGGKGTESQEVAQQLAGMRTSFLMVARAAKAAQDRPQRFRLHFQPATANVFGRSPAIEIPPLAVALGSPAAPTSGPTLPAAAERLPMKLADLGRIESLGQRALPDGINAQRYYIVMLESANGGGEENVDSLQLLRLQLADEVAAVQRAAVSKTLTVSRAALQTGGEAEAAAAGPKRKAPPAVAAEWRMNSLEDVELGPLLGRGAFGRVYRGLCNGRRVAVKVIETTASAQSRAVLSERMRKEGELSARLQHPNIIQTLGYGTWGIDVPSKVSPLGRLRSNAARAGSGTLSAAASASSSGEWEDEELYGDEGGRRLHTTESWIVLEYMNKGSLEQAVERGVFRLSRTGAAAAAANMATIVPTALDVASALAYLHDLEIIHGDLSASNVLLKQHPHNQRGFTAKVGDMGLSRSAALSDTYIKTNTQGTLTHCAPERMAEGTLTKAADVYSFGVLLWEMYCGKRAWAGVRAVRIMSLILTPHSYLDLPPGAPPLYKELTQACLQADYKGRPAFKEVIEKLNAMRSRNPFGFS